MAEHLRALIVVLFLSAPIYLITQQVLAPLTGISRFRARWSAWAFFTLLLFLAHNAWLYVLGAMILSWLFMRNEPNPMALFAMLFLSAPPMRIEVPGFGVVNYLLYIDHLRILSLVILLPAAFRLLRNPATMQFGRLTMDRLLLCYLIYTVFMALRETTITDTLRAAVYAILDVGLIYYVASRTLTSLRAATEVSVSLVTIAVLLSAIAVFETASGWLLYAAVPGALNANLAIGGYLLRDGLLRAVGTAGHSLALGYFFVVALGSWLFISGYVRSMLFRGTLSLLLGLGLFAALSRAAWLVATLIFIVHGLTLPRAGAAFLRRVLLVMLLAAAMFTSPIGPRLVEMLPYIGKVDAFNVEYRERLLDASLAVIERNPWLGSVSYLDTPEMRAMLQGQGIIDIVNTYLSVALEYGLIGLLLFLCILGLGFSSAWRQHRSQENSLEVSSLAGSLWVTLLGIALMIYTMSSITIVSWIYWWILGSAAALPVMTGRHKRTSLRASRSPVLMS